MTVHPSLWPSVCPSLHMYQHNSHCMDFREIWYWGLLCQPVEKIQTWLKSGKHNDYWNMKLKHVSLSPATLNHHKSILFDRNSIIPLTQTRVDKHLRECASMLHYTHNAHHVSLSFHLRLGLPSGTFPKGMPTNFITVPISPTRITSSFYITLLLLVKYKNH
jgi:hypothetical protein